MPMMLDHPTLEEDAEAFDQYENGPAVWMAANGHLTEDEVAAIEAEARAAARRVGDRRGTDRVRRRRLGRPARGEASGKQ